VLERSGLPARAGASTVRTRWARSSGSASRQPYWPLILDEPTNGLDPGGIVIVGFAWLVAVENIIARIVPSTEQWLPGTVFIRNDVTA
jgi:hypothetical protein